ncbi:hypothetical protein D3C81_900540 [compost metagenome]|jgi:hypothetical protein
MNFNIHTESFAAVAQLNTVVDYKLNTITIEGKSFNDFFAETVLTEEVMAKLADLCKEVGKFGPAKMMDVEKSIKPEFYPQWDRIMSVGIAMKGRY